MPGESRSGLRARLLRWAAERLRRSDGLAREFAARVKEALPDAEVMLAGSRARGEALPYSDYDIIVVVPDGNDKLGLTERLRRLKPPGLSLDLVVVERSELSDPLVREMLRGAKRLA